MNKSKFLKKSLAMVLAIMMVVAMIPLSASAAATITYATVNDVVATISGTTISVEVPSNTDMTNVVFAGTLSETGTIAVTGKSDANLVKTTINYNDKVFTGAIDFSNGNNAQDTYSANVVVSSATAGNDAGAKETYTLNVTKTTSPTSSVATLSKVQSVSNNLDAMKGYNVGSNKVTITMPFGVTLSAASLVDGNFVPTDSNAKLVKYESSGPSVTVTAQDNSTKKYAVEIVNEAGFTAFSVEGQTKSTIDNGAKTVGVDAPYGFELNKAIATTFTHGTNIKAVTAADATSYNQSGKVIKSGDKVTYAADGKATLRLWTGTGASDYADVVVTISPVLQNPEAVITDIQITSAAGKSNKVAVSGNTVSVEMPATYNFTGATADVVVTASVGSTVSVSTQGKTVAPAAATGTPKTTYTLGSVNIATKEFRITVVSEDGKATNNYDVTLTNAAASEAKITDVTLKGKDAAGNDVSYSAVINETATPKTITLTTPYALTNTTTFATYTLYVTHSVGATVSVGGSDQSFPVSTPAAGSGVIPAYNNTTALEWKVTADDGEVKTYNVYLKHDAPKTARIASAAELVDSSNPDTVATTHSAVVKKVVDTNSQESVDAIQVSVPFSFDKGSQAVWFSKLTLSDGAKAYTKASGNYVEVTAINADTVANGIATLPVLSVETDGSIDLDGNAVELYIVSEQNNVSLDPTNATVGTVKAGTKYYVYGVARAAETGSSLRSISAPLDENVTVALSGKTINITVPASYATATPTKFTLDYEVSAQASFKINSTAINANKGSADTTPVTEFTVLSSGNLAIGGVDTGAKTDIPATVTSEDGNNTTAYTVNVTVAPANTEAELKSVKVNDTNATISGKNVTVVLPYGGNLNPVTLTLTASKLASIEVDGDPYNADDNHDLNNKITITVTSEDTKTTNTYTLTGTVASQFNDVAEDAWYYDYVMQAAAAGWVQGTGSGNFSPNLNVRRGDFSLMVVNMLGADVSGYTTSAFKDVDVDHYASAAIAYLADKGIVNGDANGNFNASSYIKRQEAAKIIAGALNLTAPSTYTAYTDDASIANWAKPYVYACQAAGVMTGDTAGTFRPSANIKRSEAAKVIVDGAKVK